MLTSTQIMAIAAEQDLAAWDFSRVKKFIAIVVQVAPQLLPIILPLFGLLSTDDEKLAAATEAELESRDWVAIINLILALLVKFLDNTPEPTPAPVNDGPIA